MIFAQLNYAVSDANVYFRQHCSTSVENIPETEELKCCIDNNIIAFSVHTVTNKTPLR